MQKTLEFSKFMVCPHGQEGIEPVRTFFGQEGVGQFFAILCGRPLRTAHYRQAITQKLFKWIWLEHF